MTDYTQIPVDEFEVYPGADAFLSLNVELALYPNDGFAIDAIMVLMMPELTDEDRETLRKICRAVLGGQDMKPFTVAYDCGFALGSKTVLAINAEEAARIVRDECHEIFENNLLVKVEDRGNLASATNAMVRAQEEGA